MPFNRRTFVKAAAALGAIPAVNIIATRSYAAEFTYKFANNVPETHPTNVAMRKAAERIGQESGRRLEIRLFPSNQLGGDTDMLAQVRSGALEFYMLSPLVAATLTPSVAISGLGFAFSGYDKLWQAMDGELGSYVREELAKVGLIAQPKIWDNGFRQITTASRPINSPADLRGFKIRVPVSPMWTSLFKALGTAPASINFAELYSALQTRVVEGQENPLSIIHFGKLYEVQKYCCFSDHMWDGFWFVANRRRWEALPTDLQEIVARNVEIAATEQRAEIARLNGSLQGELEGKGMAFNKVDKTAFRQALVEAKYYAEWRDKFGAAAWSILQKYTGELG